MRKHIIHYWSYPNPDGKLKIRPTQFAKEKFRQLLKPDSAWNILMREKRNKIIFLVLQMVNEI